MTHFEETTNRNDIFGPFSQWPRKAVTRRHKVRAAMFATAAAGAGVFAHCVLPMIA